MEGHGHGHEDYSYYTLCCKLEYSEDWKEIDVITDLGNFNSRGSATGKILDVRIRSMEYRSRYRYRYGFSRLFLD